MLNQLDREDFTSKMGVLCTVLQAHRDESTYAHILLHFWIALVTLSKADALRKRNTKQKLASGFVDRVLCKNGPHRRTPRLFLQDPTSFLTTYVVYYAMYRTIKNQALHAFA